LRKLTKLRRSVKAISPVIATLLMIAIAVVASLVAYAWVMGWIGTNTAKSGSAIQIQSYAVSPDGKTLTVYVQNVGQGSVTFDPNAAVYVNSQGKPSIISGVSGNLLKPGQTATFTVTGLSLDITKSVVIKVVSSGGTFNQAQGVAPIANSKTPTAVDDTYTAIKNTALTINSQAGVLANDRYITSAVTPPATSTTHGTLSLQPDGSFTYTPNTDYTGDDSFTYQATDGTTTTSAATVTIHVVTARPALDSFEFAQIDAQVVNAAFTITVTAKDQYGGTYTSYTGTNTLSVSGSGTINPQAIIFASGVWTGDVTLSQTGTVTLSTTGGGKSGTSNSFTILNPPAQYTVTFFKGPNGDTISPAEGAHIYTEAQNPVSISATPALPGSGYHFDHWSATGTITFGDANSASTTATIHSDGTITANFAADVGPLNHFVFSPISSPQTAGTAITSVTITAVDINGNTVTSYASSTTLTETDGGSGGTVTQSPVTFANGVWSGPLTLTKSGSGVTITATTGSITGTSGSFTVNAAGVSKFAFSSIGTQTAGTAFSITITAQDTYGNTVTSYTGNPTLTCSAGTGTISPTSSGNFVSGTKTVSVTITKSGSATITATDGSITGTSGSFTVNPGALASFSFNTIGTQTRSTAFSITITALDANGNTVTSYSSTNTLSASNGVTINPTSTGAFSNGVWTGSVTLTSSSSRSSMTISTTGQSITGTSNSFKLN